MKGAVSEIFKSSVSLTFVCYLFITAFKQQHQDWPPVLLSNPISHLKEFLSQVLQPKIERNVLQEPESFMTTPEIIMNRGYPVEIHRVVTDDGYILELHRIPYGKRDGHSINNSTIQRRAIFLQHGMFCNDIFWLLSTSNNSLAYILADHGYDVWMGNSRGNTYSRKHVSLNADEDKEFWDYSWDEMGRYDIPASIDYVYNVTGQQKLAAYFSYSLGCSLFFIGTNHYPRLNNLVEMVIAFGPTVSLKQLDNYYRFASPFVKYYQMFQRWTGIGEVHANNGVLHLMTRLFCETSRIGVVLGRQWLFQLFGYSETYNEMDFARLVGHHPAGGSADTMVHFYQTYNSGDFRAFDHGTDENMKRYGTVDPPEYNLTLVTVPVVLVYSDNDPFVHSVKDINWLKARLGNLQGLVRVDSPTFSHGDFVWSPRAAELVHLPALDWLPPPFLYRNNTVLM